MRFNSRDFGKRIRGDKKVPFQWRSGVNTAETFSGGRAGKGVGLGNRG